MLLIAMKKRIYVVNYERGSDGWWVATVHGVAGCLTQGKSIEQTRTRIREALGLFVDDFETAEIADNIKLPKRIRATVSAYKTTKKKAEQIDIQQRRTAQTAAFVLKEYGFSSRDAAAILDLSHQRVSQIICASSVSSRRKRKPNAKKRSSGK